MTCDQHLKDSIWFFSPCFNETNFLLHQMKKKNRSILPIPPTVIESDRYISNTLNTFSTMQLCLFYRSSLIATLQRWFPFFRSLLRPLHIEQCRINWTMAKIFYYSVYCPRYFCGIFIWNSLSVFVGLSAPGYLTPLHSFIFSDFCIAFRIFIIHLIDFYFVLIG